MNLSFFGRKLSSETDIVNLMDDLGSALNSDPNLVFLGGGNPAKIPEAVEIFESIISKAANETGKSFGAYGVYSSPQGNEALIDSLVGYFKQTCGWNLRSSNIAIANGSQIASFILFNMLAGKTAKGFKKIALPLVPEYMGYADQGIEEGMFAPVKPVVEFVDDHLFRYQIDFNALERQKDLGALCLSRPTNPSANVVSRANMEALNEFARYRNIPFIIDCAYGLPFPGVIEPDNEFNWNSGQILLLSTSKLGLPGLRCSIVIANNSIIRTFTRINTTMNLANANPGQHILRKLIETDAISTLTQNIIPNFYTVKRQHCLRTIKHYFKNIEYKLHEPKGAFFIWLWFPSMTITSTELYNKLKNKGVLIIDGSPFFFGLDKHWPHARQCIRISFCQENDSIEKGVGIIAKVLAE